MADERSGAGAGRTVAVPPRLQGQSRYIGPVHTMQVGIMGAEVKAQLDAVIVAEMARLAGLDLAHRRRPDYREPMLPVSG